MAAKKPTRYSADEVLEGVMKVRNHMKAHSTSIKAAYDAVKPGMTYKTIRQRINRINGKGTDIPLDAIPAKEGKRAYVKRAKPTPTGRLAYAIKLLHIVCDIIQEEMR